MPVGDLQDHIHIGLSLGGSPEFAPLYSFPATDREKEYEAIIAPTRSLTGKLRIHAISSGGVPIVFTNYNYVLRVDAEGFDEAEDKVESILKPMYGRTVYFVDHYHVADGVTHASYVKQMVVTKIGPLKQFNPKLIRYYVELQLTDANTV